MITFDANHEMAGKELNFKIELVEVKQFLKIWTDYTAKDVKAATSAGGSHEGKEKDKPAAH